jgi:hypothetical protein
MTTIILKRTTTIALGWFTAFLLLILSCTMDMTTEENSLLAANGLTHHEVADLTNRAHRCPGQLELVKLGGSINHFGYDMTATPPAPIPFLRTVSGVRVWLAEYPMTRHMEIISGEAGTWSMYVIKRKGMELPVSFIYEKEGWITTKSNIITIGDEDKTGMSIQYIDPLYYNLAMKPGMEQQLSAVLGTPVTIENALAVTVGKSWASMNDTRWPHGDPGAVVIMDPPALFPGSIGPIYFDDHTRPAPALTATTFDGGVAWINLPAGIKQITAVKAPYTYTPVIFNITEHDRVLGVQLYIATPPECILSSNNSGPGLP